MDQPTRRVFLETAPGLLAVLASGRSTADDRKPDVPGLVMVMIKPGRFLMGDPRFATSADEGVAREVTIARPFEIGSTPVSQGLYRRISGDGADPSYFRGDPALPVESISWLGAVRFCNALSEHAGLTPAFAIEGERARGLAADGFRLPLEAEWEYACRAGSKGAYSHGDDEKSLAKFAWFGLGSTGSTRPLGGKAPNDWGLFDVHGNVDEWCWAWFAPLPVDPGPGTPAGPASGVFRVVRGGSYLPGPGGLRCSLRGRVEPSRRARTLGFRLARSLPYVGAAATGTIVPK